MVQRVANSVRRVTDYDRLSTQNRTEIMTGLKCNILASSPKTWPLKQGNLSVWDEKCRTVAALERCVLNTGSFACKSFGGKSNWPLKERGTLNTGGRNHKLDCIILMHGQVFLMKERNIPVSDVGDVRLPINWSKVSFL